MRLHIIYAGGSEHADAERLRINHMDFTLCEDCGLCSDLKTANETIGYRCKRGFLVKKGGGCTYGVPEGGSRC